MSRPSARALIAAGAAVGALSLVGLLFSSHTSAKIVYSLVLAASIACLWAGYRKRGAQ